MEAWVQKLEYGKEGDVTMNRREFVKLSGMGLAAAFLGGCSVSVLDGKKEMTASAQTEFPLLTHQVQDESAPIVHIIRKVDDTSMLRAYESAGKKLSGRIGIKLTFETPGGPYLDPQLLSKVQKELNGTFLDSNGFSPPRNTTEGHLLVAKEHGFTAIGPVDILDAEGEMDLPVTNGKYLKYHRTGSHFANYDSLLSVVRFKAHHIRDYGGTLKNLTICLASTSGKAIIHSAGREEVSYDPADMEEFLESMADAAKAAVDAKEGRWVFINVLFGLQPDDDCADAEALPDIGILASLDPVAVDQAAVDFTFGAAPSEDVRRKWEEKHNVRLLQYAEERGLGKRHYRLEEIF